MNENETNRNQSDSHKKSLHLKYIISAVILLLVIAALIFSFFNWEQKPDPASERVIREAAAEQLKKDPNDLTDEDFAQIEEIFLFNKNICDFRLLNQFVNLRILSISDNIVIINTPVWKKFLAKYRIIKIPTVGSRYRKYGILSRYSNEEVGLIDLSSFKKLHNLQEINLSDTQLDNLEPLAEMTNLKKLNLIMTGISDIKSLRGLKNLEMLYLDSNPIRDLESLKGLVNLQTLYIRNCPSIKDKQIEDLKKALPKLKIIRE
jgi:hypothetical protein